MSKILVIPDIHLKSSMLDKADQISPSDYDNIVCLGDIVDDWDQENNENLYKETLERILQFDKDHPEMLWCIGNHDLSYRYYLMESGFSLHMAPLINTYLDMMEDQMKNRLAVIHKVDKWLFSHAGLTNEWCLRAVKSKDINKIIKTVNKIINKTSDVKNKLWTDISPIWYRWQNEFGHGYYGPDQLSLENIETNGTIHQCTGHTPTTVPWEYYNSNELIGLSVDTFSTYRTGQPIGNSKFVIIDTENSTWQYAS